MKVLVVDDENLARKELRRLLGDIEGVEIVGEAANGIQALEMVEKKRPDLVLLDIEMPGMNGLKMAEKMVEKGMRTEVLFVTAYDHYAIQAFEVNAVDYLLKPVVPERLFAAIERARERKQEERTSNMEKLLASLELRRRRKLSVRTEESVRIIDEDDLLYASIENGVITAVAKDVTGSLSCQSLDDLEKSLGENFVRTHRRYIVNIDMVREVIPYFSGTYRLKLKNNVEIPLSRNHAKELKRLLGF